MLRNIRIPTAQEKIDSERFLVALSKSLVGTPDLMQNVPDQELQYSQEHLISHDEENVYFEYSKYVMNELDLSYPSS